MRSKVGYYKGVNKQRMKPDIKQHRMPVIYCWVNRVNKKRYVGSTVDCYKRYIEYKGGKSRTSYGYRWQFITDKSKLNQYNKQLR